MQNTPADESPSSRARRYSIWTALARSGGVLKLSGCVDFAAEDHDTRAIEIFGVVQEMKNGFKILDSDMHLREPADLWDKYIDPECRERAPRILSSTARS